MTGASGSDPADARVSSREALRFLTRAGRILSASLDPEETLERLVRLAVPRVACFAMIDLVQPGGRLDRVAYRHVDERREPLLDRGGSFLPADDGLVPLATVLDTSEPMLIENVERDWSGGEKSLERIRSLAGRSLMIVPLLVGAMERGEIDPPVRIEMLMPAIMAIGEGMALNDLPARGVPLDQIEIIVRSIIESLLRPTKGRAKPAA